MQALRIIALGIICCHGNAVAHSTVIGSEITRATEFVNESFAVAEGILLGQCQHVSMDGQEVHYVLVINRGRTNGFLFEIALAEGAWVTRNVADLNVEDGRIGLIEAMGGIATYKNLEAIAQGIYDGEVNLRFTIDFEQLIPK